MKVEKTAIEGAYILQPDVFNDDRGLFLESFNQARFNDAVGAAYTFVQDNISVSTHGVIRGLHGQRGTADQAKLVTCVEGHILDVLVDMRPESATYLQHLSVHLTSASRNQLLVPRGCLHGFSVLSEKAVVLYKCDRYYSKEHEYGVHYNDKQLAIDWQLQGIDPVVSEKDRELPDLGGLKTVL